jgi:hypothetical protein
MPIRIQCMRKKGWKAPEGVIRCSRPSIYGNPYRLNRYGRYTALALFRNTAQGIWDPKVIEGFSNDLVDSAYESHCQWVRRMGGKPVEHIQRELRGRDLSCWCKPTDPCHVDILLEIANR